jgi:RimJ/RimL family protein N-acetyltransferase
LETHLEVLRNSDEIVLAVDGQNGRVVGFISAITDGVLSAFIPFLEVLPEYQKKGIGGELVRRMLLRLKEFYTVDLLCDPELQPYYAQFGMKPATGMMIRNYEKQPGKATSTPAEKDIVSIETARLILRRFKNADLPVIFAYRNDPEVAKYQSWTATGEAELQAFIRDLKTAQPGTPGEWFQFAIELKSTKELIGDCALKVNKEDARQGKIGFTLSRKHQGKGFGTEAVSALLGYAFTKLEMHRIIAVTDCENQASINLLERLGIRREGHFAQSFCRDGNWRDEFQYAILKEEWFQRQKR